MTTKRELKEFWRDFLPKWNKGLETKEELERALILSESYDTCIAAAWCKYGDEDETPDYHSVCGYIIRNATESQARFFSDLPWILTKSTRFKRPMTLDQIDAVNSYTGEQLL